MADKFTKCLLTEESSECTKHNVLDKVSQVSCYYSIIYVYIYSINFTNVSSMQKVWNNIKYENSLRNYKSLWKKGI